MILLKYVYTSNNKVANLLLISWPICYYKGYTYFKVSLWNPTWC